MNHRHFIYQCQTKVHELQQDEFKDFQALFINSRTFKALNFCFQTQVHLRTFKFCTNPVISYSGVIVLKQRCQRGACLSKTSKNTILIIKINAQHNPLSKVIKTRFKIESIYCAVSSLT